MYTKECIEMPSYRGITTAFFLSVLLLFTPAAYAGKRLYSQVVTLDHDPDSKKPRYEVLHLPVIPQCYCITPQYKIIRELINTRNYYYAHEYITPHTTLCPEIYTNLHLSYLFTLFINADHYVDSHATQLVDKLIEFGELQEEEKCIYDDKIHTTAFRMLLSIIKPFKTHELLTFIHSTISKMLQAGCNPLLQGTIPTHVTVNSEYPLHPMIAYTEKIYQCNDTIHDYTTLIRNYFNDDCIDLLLKIAVARKNDRMLWALLKVVKERSCDQYTIDQLFKKPNFVHYCSRECCQFLPTFNFMRKLHHMHHHQRSNDVSFTFV